MRPLATTLAALFLAAGVANAMDFTDVMQLLQAGVSEEVILAQVEAEKAELDLDTEAILALKQAGASDHLVRELIATGESSRDDEDRDWRNGYYGTDYYGGSRSTVALGYDPFGYYWYGAPYYFAYYYPYECLDFGFYFAGWHNRGWWGWHGYWPTYYRDYCRVTYRHCNWWWRDDTHYVGRYEDRAERDAWRRGSGDRNWNRSVERTRTNPQVAPDRRSTRQPAQPRDRDRGWSRSRDTRSPDRGAVSQPRTPRAPSAPSTRSTPSRTRSEGSNRGGGWRR